MSEGIQTRHRRTCATNNGSRCNCRPGYRAIVFDRRSGSRVTRTFPTLAEARRWRNDTYRELEAGLRTASRGRTVIEAAEQLIDGMREGVVLTRSGDPYKPSAIRAYETARSAATSSPPSAQPASATSAVRTCSASPTRCSRPARRRRRSATRSCPCA